MARHIKHGRIFIDVDLQEDGTFVFTAGGSNPEIIETTGTDFEKSPRNFAFDLSGVQQVVAGTVTVDQLFNGYKNAIKAQANTDD